MANFNTCSGFSGSGTARNQFPTQTVATTTETILQIATDSGTNVGFYLTVPVGGQAYGANAGVDANANPTITSRSSYLAGAINGESNDQFNSSSWDGRAFKIRVSGVGTAGANAGQTLQVNLYNGSSATVGSNTKIATTGTGYAAVAGGAFNFWLEFTGCWDPTSQILSGWYTSNIAFGSGSQFTTTTVITNVVTSVTAAKLVFNATLVLGNGASSTITIREFTLDRV